MSTTEVKLLQTVESPWDVEITQQEYNEHVNNPASQVFKFQERFYAHIVYKLYKDQSYLVPDGLAAKLVDQLGYAERVA